MKTRALIVVAALLTGWLVAPAIAAAPVTRTFPANMERVWATTLAVLKVKDWDIDKQDRSIGVITTDSRSVNGENYGVYAKGTRHKLTISLKAAGDQRTNVTIERVVFKRERFVFVDKDEPLTATDQTVENELLDAIGRAL